MSVPNTKQIKLDEVEIGKAFNVFRAGQNEIAVLINKQVKKFFKLDKIIKINFNNRIIINIRM